MPSSDEFDGFEVDLELAGPEANQCQPEGPAPLDQLPAPKRRNASRTPDRFRSPAAALPPAGAGASGSELLAAPPAAASTGQQQPHIQQSAEQAVNVQQSGPAAGAACSGWTVRSIFLAGRGTDSGGAAQRASQPTPPAPTQPLQQPPPACPRSPLLGLGSSLFDGDDGGSGPLTQMAAANAPVAAAFCPHCGCFLPDLGSTEQQVQHVSSCQQHLDADAAMQMGRAAAAAAAAAAPTDAQQQRGMAGGSSNLGLPPLASEQQQPQQQQPQQQQQQLQQWDSQAASKGCDDAGSDDIEWDDAGQDGNWSEQEEATQAAVAAADLPDRAAAAAAGSVGEEEEEELDDAEQGGQQDDEEQAAQQEAEELAALHGWLEQHGLAKYAQHFLRAGAGLSLLPCLTDHDLQQMGIVALGARKKLLLAAEELLAAAVAAAEVAAGSSGSSYLLQLHGDEQRQGDARVAAAAGRQGGPDGADAAAAAAAAGMEDRRQSHARASSSGNGSGSGVGDWRALMAGAGGAAVSCNILKYFKPTGSTSSKQKAGAAAANPGCILSYLKAADGSSLPVPPAAAQQAAAAGRGRGRGKQPAGQQWAHKAVAAEGGGGGGGKRWGPRAAQVLPMRPWQVVPGTAFVVDRFCNLPQQTPYRHWFLTHFHADHYKGLNGKFDRGTLYCSPPTALLVQQQLRVKPGCIRSVPLNSPIVVEGVRVTFVDANHCPGAVMILFEPPGRRPVLHTGDCRLIPEMQQDQALVDVRGKADLILDTTYCSPEYAFPSQQEVLRFAIDAVKAEAFNPNTLFLFGSYTIGKERLFLEAARVLQRKIYVSVAKRKILDCLDLPAEYCSLLTTDDRETNLHAVPLWMVSQKHMAKLLKHYRGRFSTAVGFQPTGWTHQRDANQTRARGRRRQKGTIITYQVPYSEHSSFSELRAFVEWFRPPSIIPSVNADGGGPKARQLVALLRGQAAPQG